jgi:hypothetical protein
MRTLSTARTRFLGLTALVAAMILVTASPAAKVKVWHHHTPSQHEKASFHQAVVSSEGALRLSRQLKPLAQIDATHVWDVVEDKQGNLIVATGDEGKLYRLTPEGKASVIYTAGDSQILCMALAANGTVYAGTGPQGTLIAVPPDGKAKVIATGLDSYVWCLALAEDGQTVFAGTGPKGRIYRVSPQGTANVFYATKQEHVLCLAMGPRNTLYAGTDKNGLVYRIDEKARGFVLYQANQAEVRSLLVTADGVIAGTSSPGRGRSFSSGAGSPSAGSRLTAIKSDKVQAPAGEKTVKAIPVSNVVGSSSSSTEEARSAPVVPVSAPLAGDNSLYRIGRDGNVRELFREKTLILCLLRNNGRVLAGTGTQGQLYEIDEVTRERVEVARLDHGQIHCLCRRQDGSVVLGTGDPGKLYVLQDRFVSTGTVTSEVLDAKIVSRWGALNWRATTPKGTSVTLAVRSGNVAEPDETWSDWSVEQSDPDNGKAIAPRARFLQYRVTLSTTLPKTSPALHSLAVRYATTNLAPEVTSVEVPDLDASALENSKKLKLKWAATDPNDDELSYEVFIRKDDWPSWVRLADGLDKKEYEFDTTALPSGTYQVKVVASDRKDNAPEDALTAERISGPFPIAHTPPEVTVKAVSIEGNRAVVEAKATHPLVRLTQASFAVNGKAWANVFPTDGLFDSKTETFRFRTDELRPGTHVLVLRVRDAAGNIGSGDVVFTIRGPD